MNIIKRNLWRAFLRAFCIMAVILSGLSVASAQTFKQEQLDQLLAPIALYPDALLSQVLMASTYPDNVAQAAQWSRSNAKMQGDAAVTAVANQPWDPSVQSLVAFPQVLASMGAKPDWVQQVGDAFLAQPDAVMNTVQKLRNAAYKSGNLKTSSQQTIVVQDPSTIVIQQANPQIVYVPTYNPTVVYGSWWWPSYPPVYFPPPTGFGYGLATGIGFGVGIAITNSLWGGYDWHRHSVRIDVNRYNRINVNNRRQNSNWNHNPKYRGSSPYRDNASRQRYQRQNSGLSSSRGNGSVSSQRPNSGLSSSRGNSSVSSQRSDYRGFDKNNARDQQRQRAESAMNKSGVTSKSGKLSSQNSGENWKRQNNALSGSSSDSKQLRQQIDRGNSSRQSMQRDSRPKFERSSGGSRSGGMRGAAGARSGGGFRHR